MPLKCPACGFDSPDESRWCDFCKEPFNKKREERPSASHGGVSLEDLPPEALAKLPAELLPGQDGEKVPAPPRWLKPLAFAFLGLVVLATLALSAVVLLRMRGPARP